MRRKLRPLDSVEHVFDDQAQFGVPGDCQLAVEKQRVRIFLTGQQLQVGRKIGFEGEVKFAVFALNTKNDSHIQAAKEQLNSK